MPNIESISTQIQYYQSQGLKIFTSSSLQTHSTVLLHIISKIDKTIPIYFLNTGYHFPETIQYKDTIAELFGLQIINLTSSTPKSMQLDQNYRLLFASDPDYCCYLNKIQPMEPLLNYFDIWINGVRADQNTNRATFKLEEKSNRRALRYHPMIDWTSKMIFEYLNTHKIPKHPLDDMGYLSIGCDPCTRKFDLESLNDQRTARWFGMQKTECGLHTELIEK